LDGYLILFPNYTWRKSNPNTRNLIKVN
jgi:hypothetical protein